MNKSNYLIAFLLVTLFVFYAACNNSKKQTLAAEIKNENAVEAVDFSSAEIFTGEYKDEIRKVDSSSPPIIIDLSGEVELKNICLTDYYPNVRYIKIKHPKSSEGENFHIPKGMRMFHMVRNVPFPTFLSVIIHNKQILVGTLDGLFCYDMEGNHLSTLMESEEAKGMDMSKMVQLDLRDVKNLLSGFSVKNNICAYISNTDSIASVHLYDLKNDKEIHKRKIPGSNIQLLDDKKKTFINYSYDVRVKDVSPFMYSLTANGDTLCGFINRNVLTDMKGMSVFHNPGRHNMYHYNDQLFVRQQGNDTIFRFLSEYEINPAYVFRTGKYHASIQDIIKGNTKDKRAIDEVIETNELLLFSIRGWENLFYYDKAKGKLYESKDCLNNFPLDISDLKGNANSLYLTYSERSINNILKENKPVLSVKQKEFLNQLKTDLEDGEVLVMVLEK